MSAGRPRLDIDATRERLLALGCAHAADHLGPLLGEAVREEVPAHAFLDRLLAAELENFDFAFGGHQEPGTTEKSPSLGTFSPPAIPGDVG